MLIGSDGANYGLISYDQAMVLAYDEGLDVVVVSPNAPTPVAKLIDFGKYQYELEKQERKQKAHQHAGEVKEVKLTYKIDEHDFQTKVDRARKFLDEGLKVKVFLPLYGRENIFADRALEQIERFRTSVEAEYEAKPQKLGNRFITIMRRK
jgi:translation initiation factor IF-3